MYNNSLIMVYYYFILNIILVLYSIMWGREDINCIHGIYVVSFYFFTKAEVFVTLKNKIKNENHYFRNYWIYQPFTFNTLYVNTE